MAQKLSWSLRVYHFIQKALQIFDLMQSHDLWKTAIAFTKHSCQTYRLKLEAEYAY